MKLSVIEIQIPIQTSEYDKARRRDASDNFTKLKCAGAERDYESHTVVL